MIRPATPDDAAAICRIYNHYVLHTTVTFEEEAVAEAEMAGRIREVTASYPWIIHEEDGALTGYAYAARWRSRAAYRYAAETTVYLRPDRARAGVGSRLYRKLIEDVRAIGMHSLIAAVALPNAASATLHEKFGFRQVAHLAQVGWKFGQWIDVGYWELVL